MLGLAGSSPSHDPLVVTGHTWPSPGIVAKAASANHHGGRMVHCGGSRASAVQGCKPVLAPPLGGVGGVDRDHPQAGVGSHADQKVTEPPSRDISDRAPKALSPPAVAEGLPARPPNVGEVEVLDHDRLTAVTVGEGDELADGRPQPSVTAGGHLTVQIQGNGGRPSDWIAGGI